ncbi:hypothetical protein ACFX2F_028160 [Malus domestica]
MTPCANDITEGMAGIMVQIAFNEFSSTHPLKDITETPFTHHTIRTEVPGGIFQFVKAEVLQIGGLQDLALCPRS